MSTRDQIPTNELRAVDTMGVLLRRAATQWINTKAWDGAGACDASALPAFLKLAEIEYLRAQAAYDGGDYSDSRHSRHVRFYRKSAYEVVGPTGFPGDGDFVLYEHYDGEGNVIYIGKSRHVEQRHSAHAKLSRWWNRVEYIEFTRFDSQEELDVAEIAAIRYCLPRYNIADNPRYGR